MKHTKQTETNSAGLLLFVFPGLGKTTAAKRIPGLIDLDWGFFRKAFRVANSGDELIWHPKGGYGRTDFGPIFQSLVKAYLANGFIVLVNEPELMPWLKQLGYPTAVILPHSAEDMASRIRARDWSGNPEAQIWVLSYEKYWRAWSTGWERKAQKYKFPVVRVKYLYEDWSVMMHELQDRISK